MGSGHEHEPVHLSGKTDGQDPIGRTRVVGRSPRRVRQRCMCGIDDGPPPRVGVLFRPVWHRSVDRVFGRALTGDSTVDRGEEHLDGAGAEVDPEKQRLVGQGNALLP